MLKQLYYSFKNLYFPAPKPVTFSITFAFFSAFIIFVALDFEHPSHSITFVCPNNTSVPHCSNTFSILFIKIAVVFSFLNNGKYFSKSLLTFSGVLLTFSEVLLTFSGVLLTFSGVLLTFLKSVAASIDNSWYSCSPCFCYMHIMKCLRNSFISAC